MKRGFKFETKMGGLWAIDGVQRTGRRIMGEWGFEGSDGFTSAFTVLAITYRRKWRVR